jgi:hypothetical protein
VNVIRRRLTEPRNRDDVEFLKPQRLGRLSRRGFIAGGSLVLLASPLAAQSYGPLQPPAPSILRPPFRPENYNARFDGTTDDTTAFTTMFSAVSAAGGGEVKLPRGTSKIHAGAITVPQNCKIRGQGMGSTVLQRLSSASTGLLLDMSGTNTTTWLQENVLEDFTIDGLGPYNGGLLRIVYGNGHFINRCQFLNTNDFALQLVQVWDSVFNDNRILQCGQNSSANAFTKGNDADLGSAGSAIGSECVQLLGSILNASGFGGTNGQSSNQLRFRDNLIESFIAGAIAQCTVYGNADGTPAHDVLFDGTKFEAGTGFTGRYFVQQTTDVQNTTLRQSYMGFQSSSGTNSGLQQLIYFANSQACLIEELRANVAVNGLQSFIKMWSGGGGEINNIKAQPVGTLTKGVLWVEGGTNPNVFGTTISGTPSSIASIYNNSYTAMHSGA